MAQPAPLLDEDAIGRIRAGLDGWRSGLDNLRSLVQPRARPEELAVLRALLAGPDSRHSRLLEQVATAEVVIRRRPAPDSFSLILPGTVEALIVDLDEPVVTAPLEFREPIRGTTLVFVAFIGEGGIFSHLEGRTADGSTWPKQWSVPPDVVDRVPEALLTLPEIGLITSREKSQRQALAKWLGVAQGRLSSLRLHERASGVALNAFEAAQSAVPPSEYRSLLEITDGLGMPDLDLSGTRSAYRLDIPNTDHLVIAWVSGEADDRVLVLARDGIDESVYRIDIHDQGHTRRAIARGIKDLIRRVLSDGVDAVVAMP